MTESDSDDDLDGRLKALEQRLDRIVLRPETIEVPWTIRLSRPVYRWLGWQPNYRGEGLERLFEVLDGLSERRLEPVTEALHVGLDELEDNLEQAEQLVALRGELPPAQLGWLGRQQRVLREVHRSVEAAEGQAARALASLDPVLVAPPLVLRRDEGGRDGGDPVHHDPASEVPAATRTVELHLTAIDQVIAAARAESSFLERRRRLLEAARRLLLDAASTLPLEPEGLGLRQRYIAEQIVQIDRIQAAGIDPRVGLLHQARSAAQRRDQHRLYAALVAMESFALSAGDVRAAQAATEGLRRLQRHGASEEESLMRSAEQVFAPDVRHATTRAREQGAAQLVHRPLDDPELQGLALEYLAPGTEGMTLGAAMATDGCFDVGAPLSPVRVTEYVETARAVRFPTRDLMLSPARSVDDIPNALITDPRSVILDLAAGRLLTRRYVHFERRPEERTEMIGQVRVYLLDGSTSMLTDGVGTARARMRDAILVAELSTLLQRYQRPERHRRVVLYYRYFTKQIWALHPVMNASDALAAIGEVVSTPRHGGTNIERALLTCFDTIRQARETDPVLSHAQIVLITDGEAEVSYRKVAAAREALGEIPIGVSVIALGTENRALKQLVARQRHEGERAFYHHLDDALLDRLVRGDLTALRSLHLADMDPEALEDDILAAVDETLQALADLQTARDRAQRADSAEELTEAYAELGLPAPEEALRARLEADDRDHRALDRRYDRWFRPRGPRGAPPEPDARDAVVVVLATVTEVMSELTGDPTARRADAIELLMRLLPDAGLPPDDYLDAISGRDPAIDEALRAVHASVDGTSQSSQAPSSSHQGT